MAISNNSHYYDNTTLNEYPMVTTADGSEIIADRGGGMPKEVKKYLDGFKKVKFFSGKLQH